MKLRATLIIAASLAAALPGVAHAKQAHPGVAHANRTQPARDVASRAHRARAAGVVTLPYGGGPVLHWNRTHLIFWAPDGSGLNFDPGYQSLIETFLANVAAASRNGSNVYGLTGQYRDHNGPATYASIYGGAVTATDPLPQNGCTEPSGTGPGWTVCLTDEQLQHEIERVVRRDQLPTTANDVYFLVTPNGLGNCENAGSTSCALGGDVNGYCGYHSQTDDGLVLYAVIPYNAVSGHCQSNNPRPNRSTADPTISTISHEQSEMVTDPLGNGWVDQSSGQENGDLCVAEFGAPIGGSGDTAWNEEINGGHYYLQEEWSNRNGGCQPRARPDRVTFRVGPSLRPLAVWFAAHTYDPESRIVGYRWFFGDGRTGSGKRSAHRYQHRGQYRVTLRTTDSWGNWAFYAATLTVARSGGRAVLATKRG